MLCVQGWCIGADEGDKEPFYEMNELCHQPFGDAGSEFWDALQQMCLHGKAHSMEVACAFSDPFPEECVPCTDFCQEVISM